MQGCITKPQDHFQNTLSYLAGEESGHMLRIISIIYMDSDGEIIRLVRGVDFGLNFALVSSQVLR